MSRELRTLVPYLRRYRAAYVFGCACLVASIALKLWIPRFLGGAIDRLREHAEMQREARAIAASAGEVAGLVAESAIAIAITALAVAVVRTASRLAILGTCRRVANDLRNDLFDRLLLLAPSFYAQSSTGQIQSRCVNDVGDVQTLAGPVILYLAEIGALFAIAVSMMLGIDPELAALALLPYPFFFYGARRLARRVQEESRAAQEALGEIGAKVDESLSGELAVKTLALEERELERFRERCESYRGHNLAAAHDRAALLALMVALSSLGVGIALGVGGPRVGRDLTLGELAALVLYLQMLALPTRTLGFVISSLRRGAAALGRIRELLEAPIALTGGSERLELVGGIEVRALGISHRERRLLEGVSIHVPAGTTLGIVGRTGAGKTTLARALARLLEVEPGQLFFDGRDATTLELANLRRQIGYVPQDAFLFSATLAENVALGRPDASRAEIEAAVAAAQLAKDLAALPHGLDTLVGERGVRLSGGQRQRAAIARALLVSPRVLILDDALSAVDAETAEAILAHLRRSATGSTTILVAHRLATVRRAQQILVLDAGRAVESGTHAELCARGGRYAELWARELSRERRAQRARDLAAEGSEA